MLNYEEFEDRAPILRKVSMLGSLTKLSIDYSVYVERAFLLGLWHRSFPEYMQGDLETAYPWSHKELNPPNNGHLLHFAFISDTGDSWHAVYRDLRNRGWQRLKVHRDGGRLQYLFKISGEILQSESGWYPKGFDEIHLVLDISIKTCKQIQVGTEMKEVPIMQTVCEDLVELPDGLIQDIKDGETVTSYKIQPKTASVETAVNLIAQSAIAEAESFDGTTPEECVVVSPPHFTGQADHIAEVNGEIVVADIKHSEDSNAEASRQFQDDIPF